MKRVFYKKPKVTIVDSLLPEWSFLAGSNTAEIPIGGEGGDEDANNSSWDEEPIAIQNCLWDK